MKQIKAYILITIITFLSSCGTLKEGFKNQKKNNSDEFLVEKKSPLIMPPDFNVLPIPQEENVNDEKDEIKLIISKNNKSNNIKIDIGEKNKTIEDSLLKKIKKNNAD